LVRHTKIELPTAAKNARPEKSKNTSAECEAGGVVASAMVGAADCGGIVALASVAVPVPAFTDFIGVVEHEIVIHDNATADRTAKRETLNI
jgi:hypothetical protein